MENNGGIKQIEKELRQVPFDECEGRYYASYDGDIYLESHARVHGKNEKVLYNGKVLTKLEITPTKLGYKSLRIGKLGTKKRKQFGVHTLVAGAWLGEPKDGQEVDHIDNEPSNNNVDNLRWVTHKENMANVRRPQRKVKCWDTQEVFNSVSEVFEKYKKPGQTSIQGLYDALSDRANSSETWHGFKFYYLDQEEKLGL